MTVECPGCRARYRLKRAVPESGLEIACPECRHVYVVRSTDRAVERGAEITLPEDLATTVPDGTRVTPGAKRDAPSASAADDVEPESDEVVLRSQSALVPAAPPPPRNDVTPPPAPRRRGPTSVHDSAAMARRLLEEERLVPAERFIPSEDRAAPVRLVLLGSAVTLFVVLLGLVSLTAVWRAASRPTPGPAPPTVSVPAAPVVAPEPAPPPPAPIEPAAVTSAPDPEPAPAPKRTARPTPTANATPRPTPAVTPASGPEAPRPAAVEPTDLVDPWK